MASIIAKSILNGKKFPFDVDRTHSTSLGQRIVVVRCEQINISGSFYRNKRKSSSNSRKRAWNRIFSLLSQSSELPSKALQRQSKAGPLSLPRTESRFVQDCSRYTAHADVTTFDDVLFLGMIPHKTTRGTEALNRLKVFDGVPPPYDKKKRMVVPAALRVLKLKPGRRVSDVKII